MRGYGRLDLQKLRNLQGDRTMKELLKKLIVDKINTWTETDIYAISLFVYDDEDNPSKPTVTLGFNTESHVNQLNPEGNDPETRWNYAFWLQNQELEFGYDDTADVVKEWIENQGFTYHDDCCYDDDENDEGITNAFTSLLVDIVKEIHQEGVLTNKFGKELPILIHELEYYDQIADQNVEANGEELVKEFTDWIYSMY